MGPIIDLTTLFPWRIMLLFSFSFACYNIAHSILKDKYHPLLTWGAIFVMRILSSVLFYNNMQLNMLGYPVFALLAFLVLLFFTEGKVLHKAICIIFYIVSHLATALLLATIEAIIFQGKDYDEVFGTENLNLDFLYLHLIKVICYIAISFLFAGILKIFSQRKTKTISFKIFSYFTFIPVSHIFTIIIAMYMAPADFESTPNFGFAVNLIFYIVMGAIIAFDCSFPFIIDYFQKILEQNIRNEKELLKNKMDYQQMLMLKEEKQEFRKIKHDFINITTTAKGFIEIGKPEKALSILNSTNEDLMGLAGFSICSNETINTILYIKQQQAKNSGIHFITNISENYAVLLDDYDFCRLLNNIIDNALNAAFKVKESKECKIEIEIDESSIIVKSENNFIEKETKRKNGDHGNGIGIIKEIASKYGGKYSSRQENDVWYTETFLENKKPSDSTPPPEFWLNHAVLSGFLF